MCLHLKSCSHLLLLPEYVDRGSQDQEGSQRSKCYFLGKISIFFIFSPNTKQLNCAYGNRKSIDICRSFYLLPARQKQACLFRSGGGSDPRAGDPSATISGDTVTCNMLAGLGGIFPASSLLCMLGCWYMEDVQVLSWILFTLQNLLLVTGAEPAALGNM